MKDLFQPPLEHGQELDVKDVWSGSGVTRSGAELLQNERDSTTKWEQPWPQLVRCASIYCRMCGCVFQEDGIVARSFREEWYMSQTSFGHIFTNSSTTPTVSMATESP